MTHTFPATIVAFCTCCSVEEARRIARNLTETRLAACVNIIPGIESIYRWKDSVETANEWLLIIKTSVELFPAVESRIREIHSYEVPEVVALPITDGSEPYLAWLHAQL